MTYSNASGVTNQYIPDSSTTSIAQLNIYNRELTDVEVAEHYVVIDSQVGVLAYDAMTTEQRNG